MSPAPDSTLAHLQQTIGDLQRQLAELTAERDEFKAERDEALAQQAANAEVLGVINSSPGDLTPVFDAILEKAHSLCAATYGGLFVFEGGYFRAIAVRGYPDEFAELLRRPFHGNPFHQQLVGGTRYVQIPDVRAVAPELLGSVGQATKDTGFRTNLMVPLRREGILLGHISASRREVRPFAEKEI